MAKKTTSKSPTPRRHMRFSPDAGSYAKLDLKAKGEFRPTILALVAEESYGGCGIVVLNSDALKGKLEVGDRVKVQVGRLNPVEAEVRWRADLDSLVMRIGIMYVE